MKSAFFPTYNYSTSVDAEVLDETDLVQFFCPKSEFRNGPWNVYNPSSGRHFKKGAYVYLSDDDSDKVYYIHQGAVKIASMPNKNDEMIRAVLQAGDVFGEMAVFGGEKRMEYAQAVEDCLLYVLEKEELESLMRDKQSIYEYFFRLMSQRVRCTQKRLESMLFKDARTRIIDYLLEQALKTGRVLRGIVTLPNYLTHQEIASYTGTSRQTVTTSLNQLRDDGLIEFDRRKFRIHNLDTLEALTTPY